MLKCVSDEGRAIRQRRWLYLAGVEFNRTAAAVFFQAGDADFVHRHGVGGYAAAGRLTACTGTGDGRTGRADDEQTDQQADEGMCDPLFHCRCFIVSYQISQEYLCLILISEKKHDIEQIQGLTGKCRCLGQNLRLDV